MKNPKRYRLLGMLVFLALCLTLGWEIRETRAAEGKYPNRLMNIIIPTGPGVTDTALRVLTDDMSEHLGQPFAIVYRPAGGGVVALSSVSKAKPDGYNLLGSVDLNVMLFPSVKEGVDFTFDDFVPICSLVKIPFMLAVKADSPWKSLGDLIEAAKKSPGTFNYSVTSILGPSHLVMEMFLKTAGGLKMVPVPTSGAGAQTTALLGGHNNAALSTTANMMPHIRSGAIRPLAVFEKGRLKTLPNVPTALEQGYNLVIAQRTSLFAPKGTSGEVVKILNTSVEKVVKDRKDVIEDRLEKLSLFLDYENAEEFAKRMRAQNEPLIRIVKDLVKSIK
jgi:tripartite-type tricarboxylate transporter receptor subunit TctC